MTESRSIAPEEEKTGATIVGESRSYWQRVRRAFFRNRMAMAGLLVVFFVTTVGVFAPLIANNRPLYIEAVFEDAYDENYFIVLDAVDQLTARMEEPPQENPIDYASGLTRALDEMEGSLPEETAERLKVLGAPLKAFAAQPQPELVESVEEALAAFEEEMDLYNVTLVPVERWPAIRTLTRAEVTFMLFYIFCIALIPFAGRIGSLPKYMMFAALPAFLCTFVWFTIYPPVQDALDYRSIYEAPDFEERGGSVFRTIVPYGENENITAESRQPPTFLLAGEERAENQHFHLLGTDTNGRDVLARMVYGARVSMLIGIVAVSIYVLIGVILGAIAGYYGGWTDIVLSRLIEIVICFPVLFLILAVQAFLRPHILNIMIALGLIYWTGVARLQRGEFLRIKNQDYVQAVRALGGSHLRVIFRHILPNALGPILVLVSFGIAGSILVESTLSFLGFGVPQPTASWGDLLNNGRNDIQGTWWLTVFPGLAIFITITCFNLVGEGIRDALDPKKD